jgi:hypothetical protein
MSKKDHVASVISTGGGGTVFEHHVGASFLALLLTKAFLPVYSDSIPTQVHFQANRLGWKLDDLLIEGQDEQGEAHRLGIQIKRKFIISATNEDCVKTFVAAWKDFNNARLFNPDQDSLLLITHLGTNRLLGDLGFLLDQARASSTAKDFEARRLCAGTLNQRSKADYETIKQIIETQEGGAVDDACLRAFLRVFHVLSFDFSNSTAKDEASIKSLLNMLRSQDSPITSATDTWNALVVLAGKAAAAGQSFRRGDLPSSTLQNHRGVQAAEQGALASLIEHSEVVFRRIADEGPSGLTFSRADLDGQLDEASLDAQVILVVGAAGSGKSMLAKKHVHARSAKGTLFAFAAEEFKAPHIDQVLSHAQVPMTWTALRSLLPIHAKTFLIDGLERLLESDERGAFIDLLKATVDDPTIRLVITCRDYHAETVERSLLQPSGATFKRVVVPLLSDDELNAAQAALPALAPLLNSPPLRALLKNSFILSRVAELSWPDDQPLPQTERALRERLWSDVVVRAANIRDDLPRRRSDALTQISLARAKSLQPYVAFGADGAAAQALAADNLIATDSGRFAPAHDVFEDWALIKWISERFASCEEDFSAFASDTEDYPAIRRAYRKWLHEMLETTPSEVAKYVAAVILDLNIAEHFKDDTLVSVFQSSMAENFLISFGQTLLENDAYLIKRIIHLVRVACKTVSPLMPKGVDGTVAFHVPSGNAWATLVAFLAQRWDDIPETAYPLLISFLEDWAQGINWQTPYPPGADSAGVLVEKLFPVAIGEYRGESEKQRVVELLLRFPKSAEGLFNQLVSRAKLSHYSQRDDDAELYIKSIFKPFNCQGACRDFPAEMISLCLSKWLITKEDERYVRYPSLRDIESAFGLTLSHEFRMFPPSALQGPFFALLKSHSADGIRFIVELMNHASQYYGEQRASMEYVDPPETVILTLADGSTHNIYCNARLWGAYRATSVMPDVLQCALMALEKWLLEAIVIPSCQMFVVSALDWLLRNSNNAALVSVVASVCTAYPQQAGDAALSILGCREFFSLDLARLTHDKHPLAIGGYDSWSRFFQKERIDSNKLPHRQKSLEDLARDLQLSQQRQAVFDILDRHRAELPDPAKQDHEDLIWRLALDRMDLRKYELKTMAEDGVVQLEMRKPDNDVQALIDEAAPRQERFLAHASLWNWSRNQFQRNPERVQEAQEWPTWLAIAKKVLPESPNGLDDMRAFEGAPYISAAVCIRDHWDDMLEPDRAWCKDTVLNRIQRSPSKDLADEMFAKNPLNGSVECVSVVALIASRLDNLEARSLLLAGLLHANDDVHLAAVDGVSKYLIGINERLSRFCLWILVQRANFWNEILAREEKLDWDERARQDVNYKRMVSLVEHSSGEQWFNAEPDVGGLSFESWPDRRLADSLMRLYRAHADERIGRQVFAQCAAALTTWWELDRSGRRDRSESRDYELEHFTAESLAEFLLSSPLAQAQELIAPLLAAVETSPKGVSDFLTSLVIAYDGISTESPFWEVWNAFAKAIREAPWQKRIDSEHAEGQDAVRRSFFNIKWRSGLRCWARLGQHFADVDAHFMASNASSFVLECYARYLFHIGASSLPEALALISEKYGDRLGEIVAADSNIRWYFEALISRVLFEDLPQVKRSQKLRKAVMHLLDALIRAGSSIAFQLRDDFVTPTLSSLTV